MVHGIESWTLVLIDDDARAVDVVCGDDERAAGGEERVLRVSVALAPRGVLRGGEVPARA